MQNPKLRQAEKKQGDGLPCSRFLALLFQGVCSHPHTPNRLTHPWHFSSVNACMESIAKKEGLSRDVTGQKNYATNFSYCSLVARFNGKRP